MNKIAKFAGQMLQNKENIASRSLRILYIFILRTEKVTTFSVRNTNIYKTSRGYIMLIL